MKRIVLILIVVLVVGAIGYALYSSRNSASSGASDGTVSAADEDAIRYAAQACLAWYVREYVEGRNPARAEADSTDAKRCFTEGFRQTWATDDSGADPVLHVQDSYPSWSKTIEADIVRSAYAESDALVTFGKGDEEASVTAHLIREDGEWKIDLTYVTYES